MRIVDRATFLAMPAGTVFATYEPQVFSDLEIKGETHYDARGAAIDYQYVSLADSVVARDHDERCDVLASAVEEGATFRHDYSRTWRDGGGDVDRLYAVWDSDDLRALIETLRRCVAAGER